MGLYFTPARCRPAHLELHWTASMAGRFAYVSFLANDSYLPGLLVLAFSLDQVGSRYPLVVLITGSLPSRSRDTLQRYGIVTKQVDALHPPPGHKLARHDWRFAETWTKLR